MRSVNTKRYQRYIAANVRELRARGDITQYQLAEHTGIDPTYMQRIEYGQVNLSLDILIAMADALEVHPARLLQAAELLPPRTGRPCKKRVPRPGGSDK